MSVINEILSAPENQKELNRIDFRLEVSIILANAMADRGISQSQLAKKLNISKGRVSQVLHGDRNITIDTLADFAFALGGVINIDILSANARSPFEKIAKHWDRTEIDNWDQNTPADDRWQRSQPGKLISFGAAYERKNRQPTPESDSAGGLGYGAVHAA